MRSRRRSAFWRIGFRPCSSFAAAGRAALVVLYRPQQLRAHLRRARDNGLTKEELGEAITHLAFHGGFLERDEKKWAPVFRPHPALNF